MIGIVNMISNTLYSLYPSKDIYIENIEQNFVPGTFFIQPLVAVDNGRISHRNYRNYSYDVMYYPTDSSQQTAELMDMRDTLMDAFALMEYEGQYIKCSDMNGNIVDNVLHVTMTVRVFVDKPVETIKMEDMETNINRE